MLCIVDDGLYTGRDGEPSLWCHEDFGKWEIVRFIRLSQYLHSYNYWNFGNYYFKLYILYFNCTSKILCKKRVLFQISLMLCVYILERQNRSKKEENWVGKTFQDLYKESKCTAFIFSLYALYSYHHQYLICLQYNFHLIFFLAVDRMLWAYYSWYRTWCMEMMINRVIGGAWCYIASLRPRVNRLHGVNDKTMVVFLAGCSMLESRDTWLYWDTVWQHIFLSWSERDWESWPHASCRIPLSGSAGFSSMHEFSVSVRHVFPRHRCTLMLPSL